MILYKVQKNKREYVFLLKLLKEYRGEFWSYHFQIMQNQ